MDAKWRKFFDELRKLVVDNETASMTCNGSILGSNSLTREALENAGFDELELVNALKILNDNHAHCDCEVLLNALPRMTSERNLPF